MPILNSKGFYGKKDQLKADKANKFIGRGSINSSTNQYRKDYGQYANTGKYCKDDVVFISAEGNRRNRLSPDYAEIALAVDAGVTFITDDLENRTRSYNRGEREVSNFLIQNGYHDNSDGVWNKSIT